MIARAPLSAALACAALTAGAAASAQTSPSAAQQSPWFASGEAGPVWHLHPSAQGLHPGQRPRAQGGLSFGRDLVHAGAFALAAELGWRVEQSDTRLRSFDVRTISHQLHLGVTARLDVTRFVSPYARLCLGAAHLDAQLDGGEGDTLASAQWTPWGSLGAGVLFTSGAWFRGAGWARGRFALALEGGYQLALPVAVRVAPPTPDDPAVAADRIPSQPISLGAYDPSGVYARVALGMRF